MIKLIINIASFVLCVVIIVLGCVQSVRLTNVDAIRSDANEIAYKWQQAIVDIKTPTVPETDGEADKPADGTDDDTQIPDDSTGDNTGDTDDSTGDNTGDNDDSTGGDSSDVIETPVDKQAMTDMYDNYNEATAELNKEILANTLTSNLGTDSEESSLATDIVISYVDNLYDAIGESQSETQAKVESGEMTQEEADKIKEEFIEKETAALDSMMGLVGSMNSEEGPTEEQLEEVVDTILDSTVVSNTIKDNASAMDETTKSDLQDVLQSAVDSVNSDVELGEPEKGEILKRYQGIADLFGITLN